MDTQEPQFRPPTEILWIVLWFGALGGMGIYFSAISRPWAARALFLALSVVFVLLAVGLFRMNNLARRLGGALCVLFAVESIVELVRMHSLRGPVIRAGLSLWAASSLLSPSMAKRFASSDGVAFLAPRILSMAAYVCSGLVPGVLLLKLHAPLWASVGAAFAGLYAWGEVCEPKLLVFFARRYWIQQVLDGVEKGGNISAFLFKGTYQERFASLTAIECAQIVARLAKLSRIPPKESGADDAFTAIAGLLDEKDLPVDLDALDDVLARVPVSQRERRENLYRVLGRLQTRASLDRLMRHVVGRPDDPAHAHVWSALITTTREPRYRDVLFPRLATLLPRPDCAAHVMEIANAFHSPPHPLDDDRKKVLAWLTQEENPPARNAAARTVGLMKMKEGADALAAALAGSESQIAAEAAQALLRLDDPRGAAAIVRFCADPKTRWRAVTFAKEVDRANVVPAECLTPAVEAEDSMRQWLEHPHEFGRPPDEVVLFDSSLRNWPGKGPVRCWLFRYRYGEEWNVGLTGPTTFGLRAKELVDMPIAQIYSAYEEWDRDPKRGWPAILELAGQVLAESEKRRSTIPGAGESVQ